MLPLIRFINSFLYQEQSTNSSIENNVTSIVKDPEEAKLLELLEAPDDATDSSGDDDDDDDIVGEGPQCFQAFGIVTAVGVLDGIIDGTYRFQLKDAPGNIKEGHNVEYLAFQPSANDDIIIRKIISITDELWTEDVIEPVPKTTDNSKKKKAIFERHKVCRLSKRNGREIFIDPPGDYSFNLDHVKISFVPIPGDWLTVVMRVEESEDSLNGVGEILEILEVMPLRFKSTEGVVSHWKADQKMGIIDRETYFTLDACEIGYVPVVGDQIDAHIIESQQGHLSWRALKVIPATQRTSYNRRNDMNFRKSMLAQSADAHGELLQNKYGISISTRCNFGKLKYGNERDMIVEVKNSSKIVHQLASAGFCNKFQTQMKLIEPVLKSDQYYQIDIGETVKFVFRCQAKFFGNAEELFVWNFKAFNIGRFLRVEVEDEYLQEVKNNKYQRKPKMEIDRENIVPTKHGFIINGVRSTRKAAFIPIKLGLFKVPDQFWDIMADNKCG
ncbi:hypothetical protein LSTR_LSTR014290 [Laodelphax striatellus]|uniref:Uncharacterized protein n=1 Tax=Laodelphax striatellus TaxID=195883 RepID=A0A482WQ79_LAOST|nr:hypothetical protein LSTR_LSTR014290 [Laodelphax striatellus]